MPMISPPGGLDPQSARALTKGSKGHEEQRLRAPIMMIGNLSRAISRVSSRAVRWTALVALMVAAVALAAGKAAAQKVHSIGSLNTADQFINSFEGFKSRMAEFGYLEGKNVRYQYYNSRGNDELLRTVAQKLVQDRVDLIVTSSTTATVAAAKATAESRIPVLFVSAGNPQKLVKSFSSSGSHLAGISSATLELTGKRLQLLKELSPQVKRIALPSVPEGINYQSNVAETKEAAARIGFRCGRLPFTTCSSTRKPSSASPAKRPMRFLVLPTLS